jgi:hypothetical protein
MVLAPLTIQRSPRQSAKGINSRSRTDTAYPVYATNRRCHRQRGAHHGYVAYVLRGHTPPEDVDSLFRNAVGVGADGWLLLVYKIEAARDKHLINEASELRRK